MENDQVLEGMKSRSAVSTADLPTVTPDLPATVPTVATSESVSLNGWQVGGYVAGGAALLTVLTFGGYKLYEHLKIKKAIKAAKAEEAKKESR